MEKARQDRARFLPQGMATELRNGGQIAEVAVLPSVPGTTATVTG